MPRFSASSLKRLETCDPDLQRLFKEVVKHFDCTVLVGHRNQADQDAAFKAKVSQVRWPLSRHNSLPSQAVDVAPYPIRWPDKLTGREAEIEWRRWYMFVGTVRGIAAAMNIPIRSGADWDGDMEVRDESFYDLPHFELKK